MTEWWRAPAELQQIGRLTVVREDLLPGGSKIRFLPYLVGDAAEVVYGSPFCGGAAIALSTWAQRTGTRATLFYAKRKQLHARQRQAFRNGATLYQVPYGYMANVQAKARRYAASAGALFLPLGFDLPEATEPFIAFMRETAARLPEQPEEVWCATGSGMLARCLGHAFPRARVRAVVVGLRSRNQKQPMPPNVEMVDSPLAFECIAPTSDVPFPACGHYERKAWALLRQERGPEIPRLFWNVLGE